MMPPEPSNPLRQKLLSTQGLVALVGVLTLVIGFFVGSAIGRLICATIVVGIVLYLFKWWQNERDTSSEGGGMIPRMFHNRAATK